MTRRKFNLTGVSAAAIASAGFGLPRLASAGSAEKAARLKTTLTPMGSERAGNADGSIPPWTGGVTTVPPGWTPDQNIMTDIFASENSIVTIDSANLATYKSQISDGVAAMMQKYGFSIQVYPSHRSQALPQYVVDNIAQNAMSAQADPGGARFGFSNAYGGYPFPVPDDGPDQGGQIIWNHLTKWLGPFYVQKNTAFVVNGGQMALGSTGQLYQKFSYYDPNTSLANFNGVLILTRNNLVGPPPLYGDQVIEIDYTNPYQRPAQAWELLPGQGRVRKAPELTFDTPTPGGIQNYDEINGFFGSPVKYNWNSLGKREMFIPYNCNGQYFQEPEALLKPNYLNPQFVRWEKHRVWVVDAVLAAGERNVVPRRRFYFDEDTWVAVMIDEYDAQNNLWKVIFTYNELRPDIPGLVYAAASLHNIQSNQYTYGAAPWANPKYGSPRSTQAPSDQLFNPEDMAAQAQY